MEARRTVRGRMTRGQWLKGVVLAALVLVSPVAMTTSASAQVATTYSETRRLFKVGVLLLDSTIDTTNDATKLRGPENSDPYVFYIADDNKRGLKPQNWEFVNPIAPTAVTPDIAARWGARTNLQGPQYQVGQPVKKDMACYWEVSLTDTPIADLTKFDLLFITHHAVTRLTPADREKLRKVVDAGGIIWIDNCGGMRIAADGPLFIPNFQFRESGGSGTPFVYQRTHPILTTPYPLTDADVLNLGDKHYNGVMTGMGLNGASNNFAPQPDVLVNIVGNTAFMGADGHYLPYIAAGNYGSGRIIATSSDTGCDINDYAGGVRTSSGGNSGAFCGTDINTAHAEDLKFLYNMVAWGSSNTQFRKDPRRTAATFESVGAPLVKTFNAEDGIVPAGDFVASRTSPLVANNIVYVSGLVGGAPAIRAYNTHPSLVSGDMGRPDLALGLPYDEIWRAGSNANVALPGGTGHPSSPVLGTVYNASAPTTLPPHSNYVFVTLGDGTLVRLTALSTDNFGNALPDPTGAVNAVVGGSSSDVYPGLSAPAPVFYENKVYVVQPNGLVRCVDASTMQTLWTTYSAAQDPTYQPIGAPTLGFTRLAVSSGTVGVAANASGNTSDLMLYVPMVMDNGSGGKIVRIHAYWLGTRHEVVRDPDQASTGTYRTRAALGWPTSNRQFLAAGAPFATPKIRVYTNQYDGSGNLIRTAADSMNAGISDLRFMSPADGGTGQTAFRSDLSGFVDVLDSSGNPPTRIVNPTAGQTPDNAIISVDYDVTYVDVAASNVPPGLQNDKTNAARSSAPQVLDNYTTPDAYGLGIALTTDDTMVYAGQQTRTDNGLNVARTTVFGDYEQYGIGGRLRQAFTILEGPAPFLLAQVDKQPLVELPTLRNRLTFAAGKWTVNNTYEGLTNVVPVGAPITTNDGLAYVLARAQSPSLGTVSVLMALDLQKEVVLTLPEAYDERASVTVKQFDAMSYPPGTAGIETVSAVLGAGQKLTENLSGDAARGRITIINMRRGSQRFSTGQSFVVTYTPRSQNGQTATAVTEILTPTPVVPTSVNPTEPDPGTGSVRIDNGGFSPLLWHYILPGEPTAAPTLAGDLIYFPTTTLGLIAVDANPSSNDPAIKSGMGDQVINIADQVYDTSNAVINNGINHVHAVAPVTGVMNGAPVIAEGSLVAATTTGVFGFEQGVTLIADAKRILEVDAGSAALWTLDGTVDERVVGGELPIYDPRVVGGITNPPATGRTTAVTKPFAKPAVARRLSAADYLVADTGNNRVVRVDRSGKIRWQLDRLNDPIGILKSSDPLTLNNPSDVQLYLQVTPDANDATKPPIGYEAHYLIADAGNYRVIEVVDFFDRSGAYRNLTIPGGGTARGEQIVVWASRTTPKEARHLRFQSVQRLLDYGDPRKGQNPAFFGYPSVVAVVGNANTAGDGGGSSSDFTGGSLVVLDYRPFGVSFPIYNAAGATAGFYAPWTTVTAEPATNGLISNTLNEFLRPDGSTQRIVGPTYFQQLNLGAAGVKRSVFLICDSNGVYQIDAATRTVDWSFSQADYDNLLVSRLNLSPAEVATQAGPSKIRFLPTSVKRLANGDFLITNSWSGPTSLFTSGQFMGEVIEVEPNLPARFGGLRVPFAAPHIAVTNLGAGVRREQRMGSGATSTTNLVEQPRFGDRL